ncbi:MAG: UDP-N-acetylglucosamine 1-carboxyvinyltransferase [Verrucomicrobia bacterium]|nr:UDP-N-acetylglucosamine 1-carboxyvinyltransferase [Verrucomicrobiota bacterium]
MASPNGSKFLVHGGKPIQGEIEPQGNKNEAMPLMAAACLTDQSITLHNIPQIEDVRLMEEILHDLGLTSNESEAAQVRRTLTLQAKMTPKSTIHPELGSRLRGSVTLAGPLLARTGQVTLPRPGGDRIGRRRLDTHLQIFSSLGAQVTDIRDGIQIKAKKLKGADILLDEASVTATENGLCAAVLAEGVTVLHNAASEPHVQALGNLLNAMGAKVSGIGTNTLTIEGVKSLKGATHRISADYLEAGSFLALAAVTGGELRIRNTAPQNMRMILQTFGRLGIQTEIKGQDILIPKGQSLEVEKEFGGAIPHIADAPWPGFPADMTSVALVTATQCKGTVLIHEKLFESRLFFVDGLMEMGARIILCDPHRAVVLGSDKLRGAKLASPDIRAGMALLIAALCADGDSEIRNINQIDRGFSCIEERLRSLGAQIERA